MKKGPPLIVSLFTLWLSTTRKTKDNSLRYVPEQIQLQKLIGTWGIGANGTVNRDDESLDKWNDSTWTFTDLTIRAMNTDPIVWLESDSRSFVSSNLNRIQRADGPVVNISVSDDSLTKDFKLEESTENGRAEGVSGNDHRNYRKQYKNFKYI
ncbi:hypothetical protein FNH22_23490 [Fulvivirga sp. M361]|uniref:hypothetical protein n=1 Tax=Fulvivirga sp. M361 TaxID=2594266 RepID=UPI001179F192|nr:hypothetical protein [Fulvivirga sp. M361]TRX51730.1 hypothetical protein FNH22_23490 [Fulvivirga sp. M361]